jgi:hypothetical protein
MKKAYGEYIFSNSKALDIVEAMPHLERFSNIKENLTTQCKLYGLTTEQTIDEIALQYNAGDLELDAKFGRCTHFFFTGEGMREWFIKCAAPLTNEQSEIISKNKELKGRGSNAFMLHFVGGNSPVYLCRWIFNGIDLHTEKLIKRTSLFVLQGKGKSIISLSPENNEGHDEETKTCQSVLSSAFAYIQCFPDMVKNGIPEELNNQNHYRKTICKSIGMHPSLIISHASPCPHYRIGHFRLLSSDKFVHKKGQIIFVHGTFVKGKAMTVEGVS